MKGSIPLTWRRIPARYRLEGNQCVTCKRKYFPSRIVCPSCRRKGKLEPFKFSGKGKVYSYTEIQVPPEGFETQVPYVLALIELEEGSRVLGQIVDSRIDEVRIGSEVENVFRVIQRDDPEGLIHYGFKFKLIK